MRLRMLTLRRFKAINGSHRCTLWADRRLSGVVSRLPFAAQPGRNLYIIDASDDRSKRALKVFTNKTKCRHLFTSADILYSRIGVNSKSGEMRGFDFGVNSLLKNESAHSLGSAMNGCCSLLANLHFKSIIAGFLIQLPKNRNKRSHNTEYLMVQVFMNSMSEMVKGSHKRPYVTVLDSVTGGILRSPKSKARRHSAGQHVNGALAGQKGSKLPGHLQKSFSSKNKPLYKGGRRANRCTCECYQLDAKLRIKSSLYSTECSGVHSVPVSGGKVS